MLYYYHCNHKENNYKKANEKLDIKIQEIKEYPNLIEQNFYA